MGGEASEVVLEVFARVPPVERLGGLVVAVLEVEQPLLESL